MKAHTLSLLLLAAGLSVTPTAAQGNCAVRFAQNSALQVNGDPQPDPDNVTVEAWLKPSAQANQNQDRTAVLKPDSYRMFVSYTSGGNVRFKANFTLEHPSNGTLQVVELTSGAFPDGDWQHLAIRFDSQFGIARLLVNGQQQAQAGGFAGWTVSRPANQPLSIGWNLGSNRDNWWYGRIDELRIWNSFRSFGDIQRNRHRRIDSAPGLTSAWHFDGDLSDAAGGNTAVASQVSGSTPPTFASGTVCPGDEFPGSKVDFELLTGLNAAANDIGSKLAQPGDTLNAAVRSPSGTYTGQPVFWYVELIPTNQQPDNTTYEDIWLDLGALSELVSGAPLITGGLNFQLANYPTIPGFDIWTQAVIFDPTGPNGFVSTNLHRLRQPLPVFVSSTGSSTGAGTSADPLDSVTAGFAEAKRIGATTVFVASGQYLGETPLFDAPINVVGGLDPSNAWNPSSTPSTLRTDHRGLRVRGIQDPMVVSNLSVIAAGGVPSRDRTMEIASVALDVRNCSTALEFEDCTFEAGNGANGLDGADGQNSGNAGSNGLNGENGSATPMGMRSQGGRGGVRGPNDGGRGGEGGFDTGNGNWDGHRGVNGSGPGGGTGAQGGNSSVCGDSTSGNGGGNGDEGTRGARGTVSPAPGGALDFTGSWVPNFSTAGGRGDYGSGGGGGGGGGGQICAVAFLFFSGGAGGGGGSGGAPGDGGQPGTEGGASIAVYLFDAEPFFTDCTMIAGLGGTGGNGGNGRRGGAGGDGGGGGNGQGLQSTGSASSGPGGDGGDGGRGGAGGGGGAGHGGPSWCVLRAGLSLFHNQNSSNTLIPGSGGIGGNGGESGQNSNGNTQSAEHGLTGPIGTVGTIN